MISIWMYHEEHLDLLSGAENHLYQLVTIHWFVEAEEGLGDLL